MNTFQRVIPVSTTFGRFFKDPLGNLILEVGNTEVLRATRAREIIIYGKPVIDRRKHLYHMLYSFFNDVSMRGVGSHIRLGGSGIPIRTNTEEEDYQRNSYCFGQVRHYPDILFLSSGAILRPDKFTRDPKRIALALMNYFKWAAEVRK